MRRETRDKKVTKGPFPNSGLKYIDGMIEQSMTPPEDNLRQASEKELEKLRASPYERKADFTRLAVAAISLNDIRMYRELVTYDERIDAYYYRTQKAYGVFGEDLGPRPSKSVSAGHIRNHVEGYLADKPEPITEELLSRLSTIEKTTHSDL